MKQLDKQNKHFSKKTAILISLCVVLVASVTIIGANWDLLSLSENSPSQKSESKQQTNCSWEEFSALTSVEKDAFAESFDSPDAFLQWVDSVSPSDNDQEIAPDYPWENGGKQPTEYTWSEFLSLSVEQQDAFANTFANSHAFIAWKNYALGNDDTLSLPWESGGKQPADYTWEDFLALSATEKDAFYLTFPTTEDYTQWLNRVNP